MSPRFKIAYLILAFKKPLQLARLVRRLSSDESGFFIHIDKRSDILPFAEALRNVPSGRITFVRRVASAWGTFGQVEAILSGMRSIVDDPGRYDYLVYISGQDYPVRSKKYILSFLERNRLKNFIDFDDTGARSDTLKWRIDRYHFRLLGRRLVYPYETSKVLRKKLYEGILRPFFRLPRTHPPGLVPYIGEGSLNLNTDAVAYILSYLDRNREFVKFHRYTHCVDEVFFQTILLNATDQRIRDSLVRNCLRYSRWSPVLHHGEILTAADFDTLTRSNVLFARKFDMDVDSRILDMLDARAESAD